MARNGSATAFDIRILLILQTDLKNIFSPSSQVNKLHLFFNKVKTI